MKWLFDRTQYDFFSTAGKMLRKEVRVQRTVRSFSTLYQGPDGGVLIKDAYCTWYKDQPLFQPLKKSK